MESTWPYLTSEIPPVPGAIKRRHEDFQVEEVPAYDPCGTGDHVYLHIEKTGLSTRQAVQDIARALAIPPRTIGVAGQKDAWGVTRQFLSLERVDPDRARGLRIPRIRILAVARHRSKLRPGQLSGNRFIIRLRDAEPVRIGDVRAILDLLARRGVPNYFGPQRFGMRGDTWAIGRALLRGEYHVAAALIVGSPGPRDSGAVLEARQLAAVGEYAKAATRWPPGYPDCVRLCRALARMEGNARRALFTLDRTALGFYLSAYRSWIFNWVLAERLDTLDRILPGDLAYTHPSEAIFPVEDPAITQPRADRFEVSPTGPLLGPGMREPRGEASVIEQRILERTGASLIDFPRSGPLKSIGGRRPFRFKPEDVAVEAGADDHGPYAELRFFLPAGCYATALLREICKDSLEEG